MFRTTDIVLIAVMVSTAAFTYKAKQEAEQQYERIRHIQSQISYEEDSMDVLKADWSLLTQPSRLQKLAEIYKDELDLQPVEAEQIATLDDLPERSIDIDDYSAKRLGGMAEAGGTDGTTTGGITR